MDTTSTDTSLQPTGTSGSTNNPQQPGQNNLQPQADGNLQPTSNQSVNSVNQLDQGAASISVNAIPNTTATTAKPPTPTSTKPFFLYGLSIVVCASILAWLIYDTLKPKPAKPEKLATEPIVEPAKVTKPKPVSKPKKAKKKKHKKR